MKPLPSLSQSTNSSLALPMTSAFGLDAVSLELGEARGLRARPGMGLPWGTLRSLGLTGTASPLPWPTSTSPSLSHLDITAQGGELVPFRKETSIFSNVFVLSDAVKRLNSGYLEQAKLWVCTLSTAAAIQLLNIEWDYVTAAWRPSDGTLINHFHLVPHIHVTIYNLLCKHVGSLLTRMCSRYGTGLSHVGQFTVYSWRRDGKIEVTQYIKLEILSKTVIPIMGYRCKPGMVLIGVLWCFKINSGKGRFYIIRWRVQAALHHNEILPVHISPVIMSQQA